MRESRLSTLIFSVAFAACCLAPAYAQFGANDVFVAVGGDNAWSGRLPEPNAQRTDGPLRDLQTAVNLVRQRRVARTVWFRGGTYKVEAPVNFGPEDSGAITYAAYPGEQPVFDAGTRITGFHEQQLHGATVWVADVSGMLAKSGYFRSLFVNGQRRPRARLPKQGFYRIVDVPGRSIKAQLGEGSDSFRVNPGEVRDWKNLGDAEIRVFHFWTDERMPIESVDETSGMVKCSRTSMFVLREGWTGKWAEYFIENVFEALSETGEWYLDRTEGKLYYVPMPGETKDRTEVVAAGTFQFLRLHGAPEEGRFVTGLSFKGLTFRYSDWIQPEQDGRYFDPLVPKEKRRTQDSTARFSRGLKAATRFAGTAQSAIHAPGAISLAGAHNISIVDCRIEHVGYWGINLADGCRGNTIEGNAIVDMGGGGIKVDGANYPSEPARFSSRNRITDNVVRTGGRVFQSAAGIIITFGFDNLIAHNEVSDLYQSGIACGWGWDRQPITSHANMIEKNHIFNLGQKLSSDMGGVYLLGVQPGTVVRNNLIHDVRHALYGAMGIYTDAMAAHIVVENNIVYDISGQASYTQGVDKFANREITVRNNIFAFADQGLAAVLESYAQKARINVPGYAATYERNIFITNGEPIYAAQLGPIAQHPRNEIFLSDLNVLWDVSGKEPVPYRQGSKAEGASLTLGEWRSLGSDVHSVVADPKARDWKNRDFSLLDDSPAFRLGFQRIDMGDVGPRPKEKRQ